MRFHQNDRPYYACRADALLRSWICGDSARLQLELDCTLNTWWPADNNMDRYLLELLKVIAHGMRNCPDLYAPRSINPVVGVYLDLLQHLSTSDTRADDPAHRTAARPILVN